MRKFMRFPPRTLRFRSLLILAGAFALLAAFTPRANAALLRFYDFDGLPPDPTYGVNLASHQPAFEQGVGTELFLDNGTPGTPYPGTRTSVEAGLSGNLPPGAQANLNSLGFHRNSLANLGVEIPFHPSQFTGMYNVTSVSFAYSRNGNGYTSVQLQMSTDGGATFNINITPTPLTLTGTVFTITVPAGTTLNINNLALRLLFTGGSSNGNDLQFQLDNIQINGTVPEPATVAGGLLGVLGLCWFQRRRLIRSVRFRRASG